MIEDPAATFVGCCTNTSLFAGPATTIVTFTVAMLVPIVTTHVVLPVVQPELTVTPVVVHVVTADPLLGAAVREIWSLLLKP